MVTKSKYTTEFKEEAVRVALSSDIPYASTARNLGLSKTTLYQWISNSMPKKTTTNTPSSLQQSLEEENKALKKKLNGLKWSAIY